MVTNKTFVPFDLTPGVFDNDVFKRVLQGICAVPVDCDIANDPELRPIVQLHKVLDRRTVMTTVVWVSAVAQIHHYAGFNHSSIENNTPKSSSAPTGPSLRSRKSSAAMNNDTPPSEEESTRLYTDAQVKGIKRIRAVKAKGDLYSILGLEKEITESDIKRHIEVLALQFHPDKCGAPGTDEAFKAISHAFTVLGDADKKEHYDRPEDLFRMFMGGSEFPRFGGNGFRTFSTHNQARQRQAHQQHRQQQAGSGEGASTLIQLVQMLPVLFLGLFTLASLLSSSQPDPFSFTQTRDYTDGRVSTQHKVPYYVNRDVFRTSWASSDAQVKILEAKVESTYLAGLRLEGVQVSRKTEISNRSGVWAFGVNQKILKRALGMRLPNCQRLERWYNEATTD
ncbi:hypothetical protein BSLG_003676 [Batrachochytrium salamandrivorans]|nr:hypothetical protein BSLG_003676 [Batrachochytrium salamandrivorans]